PWNLRILAFARQGCHHSGGAENEKRQNGDNLDERKPIFEGSKVSIHIGNLGTFEYWLSLVKVVTILAFLVLGSAWLFGIGFPKVGFANYTAYGGFLPHGWSGVGLGVILGLFSFFGIEVVGSTAGEAANPKEAVPKALRSTVATLILFYVAGLA